MPCAAAAASTLRSRLLQKVFGLFLCSLLPLLMFQNRFDRALLFVDRLAMCLLLVVDADDVKTVALHDVAGLALGQREGSLFELGYGLALADPAERSALLRAAWIFGVFLGEFFKIRPALQLLKEVFGTALCFSCTFFVYLAVGSGSGVLIRMWLTFTCSGTRYSSRCLS